jgi:hypothetical protein
MNQLDKGIDTKPLIANSKDVALAIKRKHVMAHAPSDSGSYVPRRTLILP